jgi:hypothetical protein
MTPLIAILWHCVAYQAFWKTSSCRRKRLFAPTFRRRRRGGLTRTSYMPTSRVAPPSRLPRRAPSPARCRLPAPSQPQLSPGSVPSPAPGTRRRAGLTHPCRWCGNPPKLRAPLPPTHSRPLHHSPRPRTMCCVTATCSGSAVSCSPAPGRCASLPGSIANDTPATATSPAPITAATTLPSSRGKLERKIRRGWLSDTALLQ